MTELIRYILLNPTGNMTLLAETPVPEASQPLIARKLMALEPETEQVGFVTYTEDGINLRMAGGEFCGNASMCAAALYMMRKKLRNGSVQVQVSGTSKPVEVKMEMLSDTSWRGEVAMPMPLSVRDERFPDGSLHPVVQFPGITHVIMEQSMEKDKAEHLAPAWCQALGAEGLGLMFLDRKQETLKPLVFVPKAGTLFWESSCASGTTAVGAFLAYESRQNISLSLKQPGGILTISAKTDGNLFLGGKVSVVRRKAGTAL